MEDLLYRERDPKRLRHIEVFETVVHRILRDVDAIHLFAEILQIERDQNPSSYLQ